MTCDDRQRHLEVLICEAQEARRLVDYKAIEWAEKQNRLDQAEARVAELTTLLQSIRIRLPAHRDWAEWEVEVDRVLKEMREE